MALIALLSATTGRASPDDIRAIRLAEGGAVILRVAGEQVPVRMLGVGPIDRIRRESAERRILGPVSMVVRPGQGLDDGGYPLVELFRDGHSLNVAIVGEGLAKLDAADAVPPRLLERLRLAEDRAKSDRLGVWGEPEKPISRPASSDASTRPIDSMLPRVEGREVALAAGREDSFPIPTTVEDRLALASNAWIHGWLAWPDPADPDAWIAWVLGRAVLALLGIWISAQKRRRPIEGMLLGGGFGVLGVVVVACLPSSPVAPVRAPSARPGSRPTAQPARRYVPAGSRRTAPISQSSGASRLPSPLAEYVAATSSGSMMPRSKGPKSRDEAVATSDGGLDSVDLVIRPRPSDWDDVPSSPIPLLPPFWGEAPGSSVRDGSSEGPVTQSRRSGDSRLISMSRDGFESSRARDAG